MSYLILGGICFVLGIMAGIICISLSPGAKKTEEMGETTLEQYDSVEEYYAAKFKINNLK